jgi:hypothetical protein
MIKNIICAAVLAIAPMALATESSAGDCYNGGYRGHGALARPVVRHHGHAGYHNGGRYGSGYGAPIHGAYGAHQRSRYHSAYRHGYGGYGGYGGHGGHYYGGGSGIGINRGGVSLHFGF